MATLVRINHSINSLCLTIATAGDSSISVVFITVKYEMLTKTYKTVTSGIAM